MVIRLTKENMTELFIKYLEGIFDLPEVICAEVKGVVITGETVQDAGKQAFEAGFHDLYSDIDLLLRIRLPSNGSVTPEQYLKRIDRFGISEDTALGWMFVSVNNLCRVIFRNGMRYDLIFEYEYEGEGQIDPGSCKCPDDDANWPAENINRFWFTQVQALAKMYRRDYLIGAHLANMNCNDTLVMQMIIRDLKYKTSHHRYGHSEQLEYVSDLGRSPYKSDDPVRRLISDHLYAAALSYDRLVKEFYPGYRDRSDCFFAIWDWYESCYL